MSADDLCPASAPESAPMKRAAVEILFTAAFLLLALFVILTLPFAGLFSRKR